MAEQEFNLALEVQKMRKAQKTYFFLRGKATKSGSADDRKLAANTLALSKHLEKLVDDRVSQILTAGQEAVTA